MKEDLITIEEVAGYFGKGTRTIQRWLKEAQDSMSTFPLPITPPNKAKKWRRSDIENWNPQGHPRPETPGERAIRSSIVKNQLARHGIHIK